MAEDRYIEKVLSLACHGRDADGNAVLERPVYVKVTLRQSPGVTKSVSCNVECPYNTGGHGQRCKASHPEQDKVGEGVFCPYSFDFPYVLECDNTWTPPKELIEAVRGK